MHWFTKVKKQVHFVDNNDEKTDKIAQFVFSANYKKNSICYNTVILRPDTGRQLLKTTIS